jgi:hypothetical protein
VDKKLEACKEKIEESEGLAREEAEKELEALKQGPLPARTTSLLTPPISGDYHIQLLHDASDMPITMLYSDIVCPPKVSSVNKSVILTGEVRTDASFNHEGYPVSGTTSRWLHT